MLEEHVSGEIFYILLCEKGAYTIRSHSCLKNIMVLKGNKNYGAKVQDWRQQMNKSVENGQGKNS